MDATGICSKSSAHRRFQEWVPAGVFEKFWIFGLVVYDHFQGIDWKWLSMDDSTNKAPLGGEKTGPNSADRAKSGVKKGILTDGKGIPLGVVVEGANRNDFKMARETLENSVLEMPKRGKQHLCLDKG